MENVCKRIEWLLRNLVLAGQLGSEHWAGCAPSVDFMVDRPRQSKPRRVEKVQWRPPDRPWLTLNSDGASVAATGRAEGGGILRNHLGETLEAFCTPVSASSGLEAELEALLEGILIAKRHGNKVWLESDAEVLCSVLKKGQFGPTGARHTMAKIRLELRDMHWRISYIRREGNKVADYLASLGRDSWALERFKGSAIPPRARALARLDQIGMPSFRF